MTHVSKNPPVPDYVLSFDPGGSKETFAFAFCRVQNGLFEVLESGFLPIVEEIARPDFAALHGFRQTILSKYPEGTIDLVAERFMSRGFVSWLMEHVAFHLGWWCHGWDRGRCRMIMPAQWKKYLLKHPLCEPERYEAWWGKYWSHLTSAEQQKKRITHVQDAVGMNYWYWLKELRTPIKTCKI